MNEYVKKMREREQAIGGAKMLLSLGWRKELIIKRLLDAYPDLTEADARSCLAMAEEENKLVKV